MVGKLSGELHVLALIEQSGFLHCVSLAGGDGASLTWKVGKDCSGLRSATLCG